MGKRFLFWVGIFGGVVFFLAGCGVYWIGDMKSAQGKYDTAIPYYVEHLSRNPGDWQVRERLGFAYLESGELDRAIEELTRVLDQEPGDPDAVYHLGLVWLKKGERGKAIEVWRSYRNRKEPLVEREIKRHLTLLEMAESQRLARQALAEEERLQTLPPQPGTVAVFYFKDLSPDNRLRYLQKALAAMIIFDLSQVESLQVVERLRVQFLLEEMALGQTGIVDKNTAPRSGRLLGAESLVVGTIGPGSLCVGSTIARTVPEGVVGGFSVSEEEEKFFELEKTVVFKILKLLRVKLTPVERIEVDRYHTRNLEAAVYFGQGLEALDTGNWKEAKEFFRMARREDPEFQLAIAAMEACPDASAPSIGSLPFMSDSEFSAMIEGSVDTAMAEQTILAETDKPGGPVEEFVGGEEPGVPGSIVVRW